MKTVLSFINLLISLFNCTVNIYIVNINLIKNIIKFSLADEVENKPEKNLELSDTLTTVKINFLNRKIVFPNRISDPRNNSSSRFV